mmetsp:Transcript_13500/g.29745  ORF Transcript_13500/g.29745 Transcript_13500/m.29745 type:complete len:383 (+) Transcript_13500:535-1683(+)
MSVLATGRAANPMHVVIDGAHIEDDDMGDAGNVNAASDDICGNHQSKLAAAKLFQSPQARLLALSAVHGGGFEARVPEFCGQLVGILFLGHEDQHLVLWTVPQNSLKIVIQKFALLRHLFFVVIGKIHHFDGLHNAIARMAHVRLLVTEGAVLVLANADAHRLGSLIAEPGGQLLHIVRPGSREKQDLTLRTHLTADGLHFSGKSLLKHPISLIEHQIGHALQRQAFRDHKVDQTPRRGGHDFASVLHVLQLLVLFASTVHGRCPDPFGTLRGLGSFQDLMSFIHNLHGQLARRSHDQRDGRDVSAADGRLRHDVDDGRQQIGQSLATSSLSNPDDIQPRQDQGQSLGLDGQGVLDAIPLQAVQDITGQQVVQLIKGCSGCR